MKDDKDWKHVAEQRQRSIVLLLNNQRTLLKELEKLEKKIEMLEARNSQLRFKLGLEELK
jgi:hypothetical protein